MSSTGDARRRPARRMTRKNAAVARGIRLGSTVVATDDQVSSMAGGEAVILHMGDERYYGLDPVGSDVWRLLQQPRTVREIRDLLLGDYDVAAERCEADLLRLLDELAERRLVRVAAADGSTGP